MPFDTVETLINSEAEKQLPANIPDSNTRRDSLSRQRQTITRRVAQLIEAGELPVFVREQGQYAPAPPGHRLLGELRAWLDGKISEMRPGELQFNGFTRRNYQGNSYRVNINRGWITGLYVDSRQSLNSSPQDVSASPEEADGKIKQSKEALALVIGLLAVLRAEKNPQTEIERGFPNASAIAREAEALIDALTDRGFSRPANFKDRTVADAIAAGIKTMKSLLPDDAKVFD